MLKIVVSGTKREMAKIIPGEVIAKPGGFAITSRLLI
jgi:hypothetical protein